MSHKARRQVKYLFSDECRTALSASDSTALTLWHLILGKGIGTWSHLVHYVLSWDATWFLSSNFQYLINVKSTELAHRLTKVSHISTGSFRFSQSFLMMPRISSSGIIASMLSRNFSSFNLPKMSCCCRITLSKYGCSILCARLFSFQYWSIDR